MWERLEDRRVMTALSIADMTVGEDVGEFAASISLTEPLTRTVSFSVTTGPGSAEGDADYVIDTVNGSIPPGQTSTTLNFEVLQNDLEEEVESFFLRIIERFDGTPLNAEFLDREAEITIIDDDGAPAVEAEFRSFDGRGNNQTTSGSDFGVAGTQVIRKGYEAAYFDLANNNATSCFFDPSSSCDEGIGDVISTDEMPNPREVSNDIFAQSELIPNDRNLSDWVVQWGQFLTHELAIVETDTAANQKSDGTVGSYNIPVEGQRDPLGPNPIPFTRSNFDQATGRPTNNGDANPREQINDNTSFIDGSTVYGSDEVRARGLRTFTDGKLHTSANGLLPGFNDTGLPNQPATSDSFFLAGDVRANEATGLIATHALFVREHNRLADVIASQNPTFNDEQIFQWARKIVGAQIQKITYEEFLPAVMGQDEVNPTFAAPPDPMNFVYNPAIDASITNSFTTAFFRFGHSMQSPKMLLIDNNDVVRDSLSLRDSFFNPELVINDPTVVDFAMKGLASQVAQENDAMFVDDIRDFLFGPPGAGGVDLASLDIQRGRDNGLISYNIFRVKYGLSPLVDNNNDFAELTSDPQLQAALKKHYGDINRVEAIVGAIAEDHVPGSSLGEMVRQSLFEQFNRLRDGDRFFYTGDDDLKSRVVTSAIDLDGRTLASLIRDNTTISNIQENVFFAPPSLPPTAEAAAPGVAPGTLQTIEVSYRDDTAVDASSVGGRDIEIAHPSGEVTIATFVSRSTNNDTNQVTGTYQFQVPSGSDAVGRYTVRMRSGSVSDTAGEAVVAQQIGDFTVGIRGGGVLSFALSAEAIAENVSFAGSDSHVVSVEFTDSAEFNVGTVDSNDIEIRSPGGGLIPVNFEQVRIQPAQRSMRAEYSLRAPGDSWDVGDNGVYEIWTRPNQVRDTSGRSVADEQIGTFTVNIGDPSAPSASYPGFTLRINAGSDVNYTDEAGNTWLRDQHVTGGKIAVRADDQEIANGDRELFRRERWGDFDYSIPVDNGEYDVVLHFAETYHGVTANGERVFSMDVEGRKLNNFDPFAETGGRQRAITKTFDVTVRDGAIDLDFTQQIQSPMINAIEILEDLGAQFETSIEEPSEDPHRIIVTYNDDVAVDASDIGPNDIEVVFPDGSTQIPEFVRRDSFYDRSTVRGIYEITPPGGSWDPGDNGVYAVRIRHGQVTDTAGRFVPAGPIGSYTVGVPDPNTPPNAIVSVGDISAPGFYPLAFTATYADDEAVDASEIGAGDLEVIGPDGSSVPVVFVSRTSNTDASPISATYLINAPGGSWDSPDTGAYSIRLRPQQIRDSQGNFADSVTIGSFDVNLPDVLAPVAKGIASNINSARNDLHQITVEYTDNVLVDASDIGSGDIEVLLPNGGTTSATFVGKTSNVDASKITATYLVTAPGGTWEASDNGAYPIQMRSSEVSDTNGHFAETKRIGRFVVNVPDNERPKAIATASNISRTSVENQQITVTYTDNAVVDVSDVGNNDIQVIAPNGNVLIPTIVNKSTPTDSPSVTATYFLTAPGGSWSAAAGGTYFIRMGANEVTDNSDNAVTSGSIGSFHVNVGNSTPEADASAPNISTFGTRNQTITVTYTDDLAINRNSLGSNDIEVLLPNGRVERPTFVSADISANRTPIVATYRLNAPGGGYRSLDNGTYTIRMRSGAVQDVNGTSVPSGDIGSFRIGVDDQAPMATASAPDIASARNSQTITVTYSDDFAIDASDIGSSDIEVIMPNGGVRRPTFISKSSNVDTRTITAKYRLNPSSSFYGSLDNGTYQIRMRSNQVSDTTGNQAPVEIIGSFRIGIDDVAPTVTATAANISGTSVSSHDITVTYSDNEGASGIRDIGHGDIEVSWPDGPTRQPRFTSRTTGSNGSVTATFRLTAPSGVYSALDNGTYTIRLRANQVFDASQNSAPAGVLGSFTININSDDVLVDQGVAYGGNERSVESLMRDFDRDGDLDVFVSVQNGPDQVWFNDGRGNFTDSGQRLGDGRSIYGDAGDVDGDGDLDVVVASFDENRVWLNNGRGVFTDSGQVLGNPLVRSYQASLGDLDGDNDLDIVLVNQTLGGENTGDWIFINDGNGNYRDKGVSLGRDLSTGVTLADVDSDGDLDAVVSAKPQRNIVYRNDGRGNLSRYNAGFLEPGGEHLEVGDVDGDGDVDLVGASDGPNHVWLNDGRGGFFDSGQRLGDVSSSQTVLVDLDNDGDLDLFEANWTNAGSNVWINDGSGNYANAGIELSVADATEHISFGDIDGDGDADAFSSMWGTPNRVYINPLENAETNPSTPVEPTELLTVENVGYGGDERSVESLMRDFDGDGDLDVFVSLQNGPDQVWLNDGTGNYVDSGQRLGDGRSIYGDAGDVDRDGDLDVVVASFNENKIWLNDGNGRFTDSGQVLGDSTVRSYAPSLGDLDGDGDLDIFLVNQQNQNASANVGDWVFINDGNGNYSDKGLSLGNTRSTGVGLQDMDGDGDLDAVVSAKERNLIYRNDGRGNFSTYNAGPLNPGGEHLAIGDVDRDGDLDLVSATNGGNRVWLNRGNGVFIDSQQRLGNASTSHTVLVDLDGDNDLDLFEANWADAPNRVWINDGSGEFSNLDIELSIPDATEHISFGDIDRDGDMDAYASMWGTPNRVYRNNSNRTAPPSPPRFPGDVDGNDRVEFADFLVLANNFGQQVDRAFADGDFDDNGFVEFADFLLLANNFGQQA